MIYAQTIEDEELKKYLNGAYFFWNISGSVGWGCENNWMDVMFIQYLLSAAWGMDNLKCDGIFGPKTASAIKGFQRICREYIKVDGKVDAADGTRLRSTVSKTVYTIIVLNSELKKYKPLSFNDLQGDPALPLALKAFMGGGRKAVQFSQPQTLIN
jgi:peptidoglycan hydrolase-like protein with peptidoglycan-binding domain